MQDRSDRQGRQRGTQQQQAPNRAQATDQRQSLSPPRRSTQDQTTETGDVRSPFPSGRPPHPSNPSEPRPGAPAHTVRAAATASRGDQQTQQSPSTENQRLASRHPCADASSRSPPRGASVPAAVGDRGRSSRPAQVPRNSTYSGPGLFPLSFRPGRRLLKTCNPRSDVEVAPKRQGPGGDIYSFIGALAREYNRWAPSDVARMQEKPTFDEDSPEWMMYKGADSDQEAPSPSSVETICLSSPLFSPRDDPQWKRKIEVFWGYLHTHYKLSTIGNVRDTSFGVEGNFTLQDWKQIAQAVIYFEPQVQQSTTDGQPFYIAQGNWRANPRLGKATPPLDQAQSIQLVEDISAANRQTGNSKSIRDLMFTNSLGNYYIWKIDPLVDGYSGNTRLLFMVPRGIITGSEIVYWSEFALAFIQGALACPSTERLRQFPQTVAGLRDFMSR